jgi:L-methionine (R)-S-oxide reductase
MLLSHSRLAIARMLLRYHRVLNQDPQLTEWLQQILAQWNAASGTVHIRDDDGLRLAACINIPPAVQQIVQWVPKGKGMAGLAMERGKPVHTCNLQEDQSGDVRPGARAVNAQGAVAVPVHEAGGQVRAVVGLAFQHERDFTSAELGELTRAAATLPQGLSTAQQQ